MSSDISFSCIRSRGSNAALCADHCSSEAKTKRRSSLTNGSYSAASSRVLRNASTSAKSRTARTWVSQRPPKPAAVDLASATVFAASQLSISLSSSLAAFVATA